MVRAHAAAVRPQPPVGAQPHRAAAADRAQLPRTRGRARRSDDQGGAVHVLAAGRAAPRDHQGAGGAAGRGAGGGVLRHPRARVARARRAARGGLLLRRRGPSRRGITGSGASRPSLRRRRGAVRSPRRRAEGAAPGDRPDRRGRPARPAEGRGLAQPRAARVGPRRHVLARRGVRRHEPGGDRLPAGGGELRALRRDVQRRYRGSRSRRSSGSGPPAASSPSRTSPPSRSATPTDCARRDRPARSWPRSSPR